MALVRLAFGVGVVEMVDFGGDRNVSRETFQAEDVMVGLKPWL
jgi:hypothetical protein